MCSWWEIVMLQQRGVDSVCRFISHRATAFRRGRRLGKGDRIVERLYEVLGRKLHAS
jgi:hypothetical protein